MGPNKPIAAIKEIRTMHLGPDDVLLAASVDFHDAVSSQQVEATTARLETRIQSAYPAVRRLFLEAQSVKAHHAALARERQRHDFAAASANEHAAQPQNVSTPQLADRATEAPSIAEPLGDTAVSAIPKVVDQRRKKAKKSRRH
jgi:hypothetical protein